MTTLTMKEEKRLAVIQSVFRGELTVVEAGMVIGVSERQCYRIKARVNQQEVKGVIHTVISNQQSSSCAFETCARRPVLRTGGDPLQAEIVLASLFMGFDV